MSPRLRSPASLAPAVCVAAALVGCDGRETAVEPLRSDSVHGPAPRAELQPPSLSPALKQAARQAARATLRDAGLEPDSTLRLLDDLLREASSSPGGRP